VKIATDILDKSETAARKELDHYGGKKSFGWIRESAAIGGLRGAAKELAVKRRAADVAMNAAQKARNEFFGGGSNAQLGALPVADLGQKLETGAQLQAASAQQEMDYTSAATAQYAQFPLLAAYATGLDAADHLEGLAAKGDRELGDAATSEAQTRIDNIAEVRPKLGKNVFKQQHLLLLTQGRMKVTPFEARAITDHAKTIEEAEAERKMMWTCIAVGVGIAATAATAGAAAPLVAGAASVAETSLLFAAASIPAAISGGMAYDEYQNYLFAAAAHKSGFDPAEALSMDYPDMKAVAQAVIGAGIDFIVAVGAFKALAGAIRAARLSRGVQEMEAALKLAEGMRAGLGQKVLAAAGLGDEAARLSAQGGTAGQAVIRLFHFEQVPSAERLVVLAEAMDLVGVGDAVRRTGKSAESLLKLIDRESVVGRRITAYIDLAKKKPPATVLKDLAALDTMDAAAREEAVTRAIDLLGPSKTVTGAGGWVKISTKLAGGSSAQSRLVRWQREIFNNLTDFLVRRASLHEAEVAMAAGGAAGPRTIDEAKELAAAEAFVQQMTGLEASDAKLVVPWLTDVNAMKQFIQSAETSAPLAFVSPLLTKEQRAKMVIDKMNQQLVAEGYPECGFRFENKGGNGDAAWDPGTYQIVLDEAAYGRADLNNIDFHSMMGRAYHETTHAIQTNMEAEYLAVRNPHWGPKNIEEAMKLGGGKGGDITIKAVERAKAGNMPKGSARYKMAETWYESIYGKGAQKRNDIYARLETTTENLKRAQTERQAAQDRSNAITADLRNSPDERRAAIKLVDEMKDKERAAYERFKPVYEEYRSLPEEQTAWNAEAAYLAEAAKKIGQR
jgi:hypothetical protein